MNRNQKVLRNLLGLNLVNCGHSGMKELRVADFQHYSHADNSYLLANTSFSKLPLRTEQFDSDLYTTACLPSVLTNLLSW